MGFKGANTIILMVFGPLNPIIWVLGPLGVCSKWKDGWEFEMHKRFSSAGGGIHAVQGVHQLFTPNPKSP